MARGYCLKVLHKIPKPSSSVKVPQVYSYSKKRTLDVWRSEMKDCWQEHTHCNPTGQGLTNSKLIINVLSVKRNQNLENISWSLVKRWLFLVVLGLTVLRDNISVYIPKRGRKRETIDESKNGQTTPTRTHCKHSRPLPYYQPN